MPTLLEAVFEFEDVKSFVQPVDVPPFWIEIAGVSNCDGRYYILREESVCIVCEYIIRGSGTLKVDDRTFYPGEGDMYILPMYARHEYYTDLDNPWVKIFFNLNGTGVSSMLKAFGLKDQILFHNCEEFYPLFEAFYAKTKEDIPLEELMEECSVLFMRLLQRLSNKVRKSHQNSSYSEEAEKLKEFIEKNINKELTVKEIAASIYRSPDYANKLFNRLYGTSPYAYYITVRIEKAKALLQHTSLSVREISERLGYKSSQYFSKQFHRVTGMTANCYRRMGQDISKSI